MLGDDSFRIQADVVVVSATQFYAPGQLELRAGRIVSVGAKTADRADASLEGFALLPGLVNPHTHLEFSDLSHPLPPGKTFPDWIASVLAQRRSRETDAEERLVGALAAGLEESRNAGVAALVDIVTPPWMPDHLRAATAMRPDNEECYHQLPESLKSCLSMGRWQQLRMSASRLGRLPVVYACLEQLGLTDERVRTAREWRERVETRSQSEWPANLVGLGLSPHAPYSTLDSVTRPAIDAAVAARRLIAMHVAESEAERQWIDEGTGPLTEFHAQLRLAPVPRSKRMIVDLCHTLGKAQHALLIHGNYLSATEMDAIAEHRELLSVVYCPRTHRHFGHAAYPLESLSSRGIRVVFGTDSRSSNPDLNLWQEARTALAVHRNLGPSAALSAITQCAAEAIGRQADFGCLLPGRIAAINVVPLSNVVRSTSSKTFEELLGGWFETVPHPFPLAFA